MFIYFLLCVASSGGGGGLGGMQDSTAQPTPSCRKRSRELTSGPQTATDQTVQSGARTPSARCKRKRKRSTRCERDLLEHHSDGAMPNVQPSPEILRPTSKSASTCDPSNPRQTPTVNDSPKKFTPKRGITESQPPPQRPYNRAAILLVFIKIIF